MPIVTKQPTLRLLILLFSMLSFIFLVLNVIYEPLPESFIGVPVASFFSGTLITIFFIGLWYVIRKYISLRQFSSAAEVAGFLCWLALGAVLIGAVPYILGFSGIDPALPLNLEVTYFAILLLLITIFYLSAHQLFRGHITAGKSKAFLQQWRTYIAVMLAANIFNYYYLVIPEWFGHVYLIATIAGCLPFLVQVQWVARLNKEERWKNISLTGILLLLSVAATYIFWNMPLREIFHIDLGKNIAFTIIVAFVNIYLFISFLALVFNWPSAGVIRDKQDEIDTLEHIMNMAEAGAQRDQVIGYIFEKCMLHSGADAGWVVINRQETGEEIILKEENIDPNDLKRIQFTVTYNKKHFLTRHDSEYRDIPDFSRDLHLQHHMLPFTAMRIFSLHIPGMYSAKFYLLHESVNGFENSGAGKLTRFISQAKLALQQRSAFPDAVHSGIIKKEAEVGRNLQKSLLPSQFPDNDVIEMAAVSIAAEEVGGDYYDFHRISEHQVAVIMADASGKGTPAAFHVAEMKGIFQSLVLNKIKPAEFIKKANQAISRCYEKGMFITAIYLIIDLKKKTIRYSRAGHCPILHYCNDGKFIHYLEDEGLGLGIVRSLKYEEMVSEHEFSFEAGDVIALYTDGVVEARSPKQREEWGFEKLKDSVRVHSRNNAGEILNNVVSEVTSFTNYDMSSDDISIMVFKAK